MNLYMEMWPYVIPWLFYPLVSPGSIEQKENLEHKLCTAEHPGYWIY